MGARVLKVQIGNASHVVLFISISIFHFPEKINVNKNCTCIVFFVVVRYSDIQSSLISTSIFFFTPFTLLTRYFLAWYEKQEVGMLLSMKPSQTKRYSTRQESERKSFVYISQVSISIILPSKVLCYWWEIARVFSLRIPLLP